MRFDRALERAVHDRAPEGVHFTDTEVRQALQWAVDVRDGGNQQLTPWLENTAHGRAARAALESYRQAPPVPPAWWVVGLRAATVGVLALVVATVTVGVVHLVGALGGFDVGLSMSWRGAALVFLSWTALGLVFRQHLGLTAPTQPLAHLKAEVQVVRQRAPEDAETDERTEESASR